MNVYLATILGLLIGFIVGWLIQRNRMREVGENQQNIQNKLEATRTEIKLLRTKVEAEIKASQSKVEESDRKAQIVYKKADHLEDVNGIGPVFAQRLNNAGIYTFDDLAGQTPERVREIISPKNWQAVDPEGWISQAQHLSEG